MTHQPETPLANIISRLRWGLGAHATGTEALYREGDADYWTAFKRRNPELADKVETAYNAFVKLREKPGDNGPLGISYYSEHFDRWLAEAAHNQGIHEATRTDSPKGTHTRPTPLDVMQLAKRRYKPRHAHTEEAQ